MGKSHCTATTHGFLDSFINDFILFTFQWHAYYYALKIQSKTESRNRSFSFYIRCVLYFCIFNGNYNFWVLSAEIQPPQNCEWKTNKKKWIKMIETFTYAACRCTFYGRYFNGSNFNCNMHIAHCTDARTSGIWMIDFSLTDEYILLCARKASTTCENVFESDCSTL